MTQAEKVGPQFRQGDVLVVLVPTTMTEIPTGAKEVAPEGKGVVLAHGEVTGHKHQIEVEILDGAETEVPTPNVKYFDYGAERYIQALVDVTLRHEEHGAIVLKKGVYRQAFQVEDFGTERRAVAD